MVFSFICVYNNEALYKEKLLSSIQSQCFKDYEIIGIDSKAKGFKSASEALNYGGSKAVGDYLIFVHQDVVIENVDFLETLSRYCKGTEFGIAGIAGLDVSNGKRTFLTNIYHGTDRHKASVHEVTRPTDVYCLDECMLIIPRKVFATYQFCNLGSTWHLYGTDYSLKMKAAGKRVVIFPAEVWHLSDGKSMNASYYKTILKLCKLYRTSGKSIYTIYGAWPTNPILLYPKCYYRLLRLKVKGY